MRPLRQYHIVCLLVLLFTRPLYASNNRPIEEAFGLHICQSLITAFASAKVMWGFDKFTNSAEIFSIPVSDFKLLSDPAFTKFPRVVKQLRDPDYSALLQSTETALIVGVAQGDAVNYLLAKTKESIGREWALYQGREQAFTIARELFPNDPRFMHIDDIDDSSLGVLKKSIRGYELPLLTFVASEVGGLVTQPGSTMHLICGVGVVGSVLCLLGKVFIREWFEHKRMVNGPEIFFAELEKVAKRTELLASGPSPHTVLDEIERDLSQRRGPFSTTVALTANDDFSVETRYGLMTYGKEDDGEPFLTMVTRDVSGFISKSLPFPKFW